MATTLFHTTKIFCRTIIFLVYIVPSFSMAISEMKNSDSLRVYSYDKLYDKIRNSKKDEIVQKIYLNAFLQKAKAENNTEELFNAYRNFVNVEAGDVVFVYADSMILTAKSAGNSELLGSAYLSRGIAQYGKKKYIAALDDYLIADAVISETPNKYLQHKIKYNIAQVKYYLSSYEEAIELYKQCITYFKKDHPRAYLNSLHSLSLCHHRMGNIGMSSELNQMGIYEGERLYDLSMMPYFKYLEGVNHYFRNNHELSIKEISASIEEISANQDFANEAVAYFYLAKSYNELRNKSKALSYFLKVDEIFTAHHYIRSDLRETFEFLLQHARSMNDAALERHYIRQLLKADSILIENQQQLPSKIYKEYDSKELSQAKIKAEKEKAQEITLKRIFLFVCLVLSFVTMFLGVRSFRNKRIYEHKFEQLMKQTNTDAGKIQKQNLKSESLNLNPTVLVSLLKQLEKFEKNHKYLDKDVSQAKLSSMFQSNNKYLSTLILQYRNKGFNEYINDLRIDYIIELLKSDRKTRKYNNAALAELAGFTTIERFAKAFKSRTGMPPSFFIEKLKKDIDEKET